VRQVVLDTETTGLSPELGHRILEIGCVEIVDRKLTRRHYHQYINPQREIDDGALEVHGITQEFLKDKPVFKDIFNPFLEYVKGAELIIHNAPFDVGFINREMRLISPQLGKITDYCSIVDSLEVARNKHPGQKNNLNALCKRYMVDNSQRDLHGALLDSEILADVYLLMTGGQVTLSLGEDESTRLDDGAGVRRISSERGALRVVRANSDEIDRHQQYLGDLKENTGVEALWNEN
jgi:DNA polymerase-3 subunit epsilon